MILDLYLKASIDTVGVDLLNKTKCLKRKATNPLLSRYHPDLYFVKILDGETMNDLHNHFGISTH